VKQTSKIWSNRRIWWKTTIKKKELNFIYFRNLLMPKTMLILPFTPLKNLWVSTKISFLLKKSKKSNQK
jgi:hypothetical protein